MFYKHPSCSFSEISCTRLFEEKKVNHCTALRPRLLLLLLLFKASTVLRRSALPRMRGTVGMEAPKAPVADTPATTMGSKMGCAPMTANSSDKERIRPRNFILNQLPDNVSPC